MFLRVKRHWLLAEHLGSEKAVLKSGCINTYYVNL
jgi:hypothetical protein